LLQHRLVQDQSLIALGPAGLDPQGDLAALEAGLRRLARGSL